jgi:hypothetical protein
LQPFLVQPFFDQVPNKGFALLAAGQFATRMQEFGLGLAQIDFSSKQCGHFKGFLSLVGE